MAGLGLMTFTVTISCWYNGVCWLATCLNDSLPSEELSDHMLTMIVKILASWGNVSWLLLLLVPRHITAQGFPVQLNTRNWLSFICCLVSWTQCVFSWIRVKLFSSCLQKKRIYYCYFCWFAIFTHNFFFLNKYMFLFFFVFFFQKSRHHPEVSYFRYNASNLPGMYDYSCLFSRATWGCVKTAYNVSHAKLMCTEDPLCKAFIILSGHPDTDSKFKMYFFIYFNIFSFTK